ncbi:MAG: aminoglycoside 3'-phosphotransferase [Ruminococcaceae bacterium]|nr:aminoglycoside 3'-phosphotransferase [Oscillospiraceae bacterium]
MKKSPIALKSDHFPDALRPFLDGGTIFDSSSSPDARVFFIENQGQYFLKVAPKGSLSSEAQMTRYFHTLSLSTQVLYYISTDKDYLLTARLHGEDCLDAKYISQPTRLCDITAQLLRQLHDTPPLHCPAPHQTAMRIRRAAENYHTSCFDSSLFPDNWGYASAEDAFRVIEQDAPCLHADTLLHGDYCLPNIILNDWRFSGFIDLGAAGIGDRHMDLFWGLWSLEFNLKTNRYNGRFLDVYGRDKIIMDVFPVIAALEVFS